MPPVVEMKNIVKRFGSIVAVDNVNINLRKGEILAIVGDNAAGKSTLLKCLAGIYRPDSGEIYVNGKKVEFSSPLDARKLGIELVPQDFALVPCRDVVSNLFMGREITTKVLGFIPLLDVKKMKKMAEEHLSRLNIKIKSTQTVGTASGGQQQAVSIARALFFRPRILLLDEPSASLSIVAIERLLRLMKELKKQGTSQIFITHRLRDVMEVADRIYVMRRGKIIAERLASETNIEELTRLMLGEKEEVVEVFE